MKRQFDGNPEQHWRHEPLVLFLDETLHNCRPILAVLNELGIKFERHGQHFKPGTLDEIWLPVVGQNRWTLLTHDQRIRYNRLQIEEVRENRVREFVFTSGHLSGVMMAEILRKAIPKMQRLLKRCEPPFIASLTSSGNVVLRYDREGSLYERKRVDRN